MNFLTFPNEFDNAAWSKARSSVSADVTTDPLGGSAADKLVEAGNLGGHGLFRNLATLTVSTPYTFYCYFKQAEKTWFELAIDTFAGISVAQWFNIATGTAGSHSGSGFLNAGISSFGGGWHRAWLSAGSGTGGNTPGVEINLADADGSLSYTGNGVDGIYLWGADFEANTDYLDPLIFGGAL